MEYSAIASGSSGNCIFVRSNGTGVLIDAGITGKRIYANLSELGCDPQRDVHGLLVTHEHQDHVCAVGVVARKLRIPVYANAATWQGMSSFVGKIPDEQRQVFRSGETFSVGDLQITSFCTSHDALESVGYIIDDGRWKLGIVTDTGLLTPQMLQILKNVDELILEANHDLDLLQKGRYPWPLKKRIMGEFGHLSNRAAAAAVEFLVKNGRISEGRVVLGHLSEENNRPELVLKEVLARLAEAKIVPGRDILIELAYRDRRTPLYKVG